MIECENKKCALYFGVIAVFVLSCVLCGVYYNGHADRSNGAGIGKAVGEQREITDRITEAEIRASDGEVRIDDSQRAVEDAAQRADRIGDIISQTGDSIERCRLILKEVRAHPVKKGDDGVQPKT